MKFQPGGKPRYKHQKQGLKRILETGGVTALLMEPGTGKTYVALDYAAVLALKLPATPDGVQEARVLVVAPLAAVDSWIDQTVEGMSPQVDYWAEVIGGTIREKGEALAARGGAPFKRGTKPATQGVDPSALHVRKATTFAAYAQGHDVDPRKGPAGFPGSRPRVILEVINLDAFSRRDEIRGGTLADHMLAAVKRFGPDLLVVDEMHKLKTPSSNTSRLMYRISPRVKRRLGLTGTVMPKSPIDVYGQWKYLEPEAFGTIDKNGRRKAANKQEFEDRYVQFGGFMGKEIVGFKNLDELQNIMAKNSIVVRKEDALDLPPTTDAVVKFNLNHAEQKAYTEIRKKLATEFTDGETAHVDNPLTRSLRLRQITSGHLPDDNKEIRDLGGTRIKTIASLVNDTLADEKRVVVFSLFSHEVRQLTKALKTRGTEVMVISGATKSSQRIAIRKRFGSKAPGRMVLVAQVSTLSLAVNELVTASHAVYGSMTLQRSDYIQSKDRLNRIGQTRPVTFWHVEAAGTIDEIVRASHQQGTDLESDILKHIMSAG